MGVFYIHSFRLILSSWN